MPVRNFPGAGTIIVPSPTYFNGSFTWMGVLKRNSAGAWRTPFSISNGSDSWWSINFSDGGDFWWQSNNTVSSFAIESTHDWDSLTWRLVAVVYDNAGGYRFHDFDGTTWFHGNHISANNPTADPENWTDNSTVLRFGSWDNDDNFFDGLMGMQALNVGMVLNDGQIESLAGGGRDDYVAADFDHLWEFNQSATTEPVTDYIGSLDQTSLVAGTTVVTDNDPPSALYVFAGGGITVDQSEAGTGGVAGGAASVAATLGAGISGPGLAVAKVGWWTATGVTLGTITDDGPGLEWTIHVQGGPFSAKCAIATAPDPTGALNANDVVTGAFVGGTASGAAIGVSYLTGADLTGARIEDIATPIADEGDVNWATGMMDVSNTTGIIGAAFNESSAEGATTPYTKLVDTADGFGNGLTSVLRVPGAGSFNVGGAWAEGTVVNSVTAAIAIRSGGGPEPEPNYTAFLKWGGVRTPSVVHVKVDGVLYPPL